MSDVTKIGSKKFTAELVSQSSMRSTDLGKHESTMTLYAFNNQAGSAFIEWEIPDLEEVVDIGLSFDVRRNLLDYDGVFSLPREAVALLRKHGFKVGKDFVQ